MYERIVKVSFKDELSRKALLSYLHPITKQQGEAFGLISMTSTQVSGNIMVTTYLWPDYETAKAAFDDYGSKIIDAIRNAGAKVEIQEGPVERAWFNEACDTKSLNTF